MIPGIEILSYAVHQVSSKASRVRLNPKSLNKKVVRFVQR
jgi:hypothetical protein